MNENARGEKRQWDGCTTSRGQAATTTIRAAKVSGGLLPAHCLRDFGAHAIENLVSSALGWSLKVVTGRNVPREGTFAQTILSAGKGERVVARWTTMICCTN